MARSKKPRIEKKTFADLKKPGDTTIAQEKPISSGGLSFNNCLICGGAIIEGYYGRFGDSGVCSKQCYVTYMAQSRQASEAAAAAMTRHI